MTGERAALGAAIVLAGGGSSRMGRSKASLEWEGAPLLSRTVATLGGVAARVVVVRAAGQELPPLPAAVSIVEDAHPGRGPLEGLLAGLRRLERPDEAAFVCATDMPLLHPRFVERVAALLGPHDDAAIPEVEGRRQPLAGVYRGRVAGPVAARLDAGRLSLMGLLDAIRTRRLEPATLLADPALAAADPRLDSLLNLNTPAEHATALARAAQASRENATRAPTAPSSSSPSQASAVAPASEVTA